jgi:hypothetical protein
MMKTLRILFTILCAICLAVAMPLGTFFDWLWALPCLLLAGVFFMLMWICKGAQENQERKQNPPKPQGDYLSPLPKTDETETEE